MIDVGAGASTLADSLLEEGRGDVTLLDVSAVALEVTRQRPGDGAPEREHHVTPAGHEQAFTWARLRAPR